MTKICNHCHIEKDITEFNRNAKSPDGHRDECKSCHSEQNKRWREKNLDRLLKQCHDYKVNNKESILESTKRWQQDQRDNHTDHALAHSLRTRLNSALKGNAKAGSAVQDLGCSIEEFRKYIESKFLLGMSWDNRGRWGYVWHIDHIKPLKGFDLSVREQFLEACHYTNLQPMWCVDNNTKADK